MNPEIQLRLWRVQALIFSSSFHLLNPDLEFPLRFTQERTQGGEGANRRPIRAARANRNRSETTLQGFLLKSWNFLSTLLRFTT